MKSYQYDLQNIMRKSHFSVHDSMDVRELAKYSLQRYLQETKNLGMEEVVIFKDNQRTKIGCIVPK